MRLQTLIPLIFLTAVLLAGCPKSQPDNGNGAVDKKDDDVSRADSGPPLTEEQQRVLGITRSERMLQGLSSKMKLLSRNFKEDGFDTSKIAASEVEFDHLLAEGDVDQLAKESLDNTEDVAAFFQWPINDEVKSGPLNQIWPAITSKYRFEDAQIGTLKGYFSESGEEFLMETKFEGKIVAQNDKRYGVKGKQVLTWKEVEPDNWKIVAWKQKELKLLSAEGLLFENITQQVFPDPDLFKKISTASHEDKIVEQAGKINLKMSIKDVDEDYKAFSDWESTGQYPSVSVVDFDNDGDDDIFLTDRWQSPSLLSNQGDGTFKDVTAEVGLEFGDYVNCGYFFDYDNDGDADLLVGYSVKPSKFFTNEGGTFKPHEKINEVLDDTRVVVAASAADVNRDGLLDLYLCTYSSATGPIDEWLEFVTRPIERVKTRLRIERHDKFVDRGGPPNIMLLNRGDTFEWADIDDATKQYRSSYQSSWTDWDNDGDPDLYVCNDFSPDVFLRNDTERGSFKPKFVDVTGEIAPTVQMGFGMGTSFGDFDNDADLDLYVCNMYSKAGNRIMAQLEEVDERLAVGARGNFLYENLGDEFIQVAGDGDDQQHINIVGWSFGGQFADFDNDGFLDLFVPSGFYSAPQEVATDVDL